MLLKGFHKIVEISEWAQFNPFLLDRNSTVVIAYAIIKNRNIVTNELLYHQIERILKKLTNKNIISYAENEKVKMH